MLGHLPKANSKCTICYVTGDATTIGQCNEIELSLYNRLTIYDYDYQLKYKARARLSFNTCMPTYV